MEAPSRGYGPGMQIGRTFVLPRTDQKEDSFMQETGERQGVRPPVPPFTEETAREKVKKAEEAWNTRDPEKVALAYTEDSAWRNRDEFFEGGEEIIAFLQRSS